MNQKTAVSKINKSGILLVFPINNKKEPASLWSEFFPKSKMQWSWNEDSDHRVGDLWQLMKKLSDCQQVVYSKWYQNRATFFSRQLFTALLSIMQKKQLPTLRLSKSAKNILELLESDSPLSTKVIKKLVELQGKDNQATYNRAMKELFSNLLIVAYGEVDDGAFPSLAIGCTKVLYEDLWTEANEMNLTVAEAIQAKFIARDSLFKKQLDKNQKII